MSTKVSKDWKENKYSLGREDWCQKAELIGNNCSTVLLGDPWIYYQHNSPLYFAQGPVQIVLSRCLLALIWSTVNLIHDAPPPVVCDVFENLITGRHHRIFLSFIS
jgi:hypothetical protein